MFTQNWRPKIKAKHVPERIQKALKLANKHGVRLEASKPDNETKTGLPIWLHRKTNNEAARLYKKNEAKCLKTKHKTHYVYQITHLIEDVNENHKKTNFCTCETCQTMSRLGCTHPNGCIEMAHKLIETIAPAWRATTEDEQTTTHRMSARKIRSQNSFIFFKSHHSFTSFSLSYALTMILL